MIRIEQFSGLLALPCSQFGTAIQSFQVAGSFKYPTYFLVSRVLALNPRGYTHSGCNHPKRGIDLLACAGNSGVPC